MSPVSLACTALLNNLTHLQANCFKYSAQLFKNQVISIPVKTPKAPRENLIRLRFF